MGAGELVNYLECLSVVIIVMNNHNLMRKYLKNLNKSYLLSIM